MAESNSWSVLVPDRYRPEVGAAIARGEDWMESCPEGVAFARDALLGMCEDQIRFAHLQLENAKMMGELPDPRWASELRQSTALAARVLGLSGVRRRPAVEEEMEEPEATPVEVVVGAARTEVLAALEAAAAVS